MHAATLRVLAEVGVALESPLGREVLTGAGATVREERVLLPPDLVENALAHCPAQVRLRGRSGASVALGDGALHWHNLGGARDVYDPRSGQRRPAGVQDVIDSTRLLDAMDQATSVTPLFTPQDVPGEIMSLAMYRHALPHTTKPVHGPGVQTAQEVEYAVRMAQVIGPPSEVLSLGISPVSPLTFPDDVVEAMLAAARHSIPLGPLPCPTAGTTAPLSMAGALVQQNAEILASIVLVELAQPGLPVMYTGRLAMMEPRTAISVWGGIELGLLSAATVQLGHRYGLPVNVYGFSTNAHLPNLQNGYERALNALLPALAGADELSGIGEMEAGVLSCQAQIVADNEIAASVQRALRGFDTGEEALAVEVIAAVMDGPRNFVAQRHTRQFLRSGEISLSRLPERRSWEEWDRSGREGLLERCQAEAERLIAGHQVEPLAPEQERELDDILKEAEGRDRTRTSTDGR
jgi:trimethylamine--corrinoid protein Co-methyltransferase